MNMSLRPIDVGFDPRVHGMLCRVTARTVDYLDAENRPQTVTGDEQLVAETLARAGYCVVVAETANGRDVQCTPAEHAPAGERPGYEWRGPVWAVQAKSDNYWCMGPSLHSAADRAGWTDGELRSLAAGAK